MMNSTQALAAGSGLSVEDSVGSCQASKTLSGNCLHDGASAVELAMFPEGLGESSESILEQAAWLGDRLGAGQASFRDAVEAAHLLTASKAMLSSRERVITGDIEVVTREKVILRVLESYHDRKLRRLEEMAVRDALTGAYNRWFFEDALRRETDTARRHAHALTLVMFDVDGLKRANDTLGHLTGDVWIRTACRAITQSCRSSDVVARYGGDEFAVILPHTPSRGGVALARRAQACLSCDPESCRLGVRLSAGVASLPDHGVTPSALIAAADSALYRAKRAGGGDVCVSGRGKTGGPPDQPALL